MKFKIYADSPVVEFDSEDVQGFLTQCEGSVRVDVYSDSKKKYIVKSTKVEDIVGEYLWQTLLQELVVSVDLDSTFTIHIN